MKRLLFIFVILAILLCGCHAATQLQYSETADSTHPTNENLLIDVPIGEGIVTYGEYEAFVQSNGLPYKCPHYNDLRHFGEFSCFYYHYRSYDSDSNHRYLLYKFNDGSGMKVSITFTYEMLSQLDYRDRISDTDIQLSDMRYSKRGGVYDFDGFYYAYDDDGRLTEIFWLDEDTQYKIDTGLDEFSNYPYGCDTLVSELLDLEGKTAFDIALLLSGINK